MHLPKQQQHVLLLLLLGLLLLPSFPLPSLAGVTCDYNAPCQIADRVPPRKRAAASFLFFSPLDCLGWCREYQDCSWMVFYSNASWRQPNCFCYTGGYGPPWDGCDDSQLAPPDPRLGTAVFSSYYDGNCPKIQTAPVHARSLPPTVCDSYFPCQETSTVLMPNMGWPRITTSTSQECTEKCAENFPDCHYMVWFSRPPPGRANCYLSNTYYCREEFMAYADNLWGRAVTARMYDLDQGIDVPQQCPDIPLGSGADDPHFVGAYGTRYDFNGKLNRDFCIISDRGLHLNARFKGYTSANNTFGATVQADGTALRTWMRELGLIWKDSASKKHTLHLVARSGNCDKGAAAYLRLATYNGARLAIPSQPGVMVNNSELTLKYLGSSQTKYFNKDRFFVLVAGKLAMHVELMPAKPIFQLKDECEVHFNIQVTSLEAGGSVDGILGETFRNTQAQVLKAIKYSALNKVLGGPVKADGASGVGFLDGKVSDYESSGILAPDCKLSKFQ